MKKNKSTKDLKDNNGQTGKPIKSNMPIKNPMTDTVKNTASQTTGLNQANVTRDDLFPSDGDNPTN